MGSFFAEISKSETMFCEWKNAKKYPLYLKIISDGQQICFDRGEKIRECVPHINNSKKQNQLC